MEVLGMIAGIVMGYVFFGMKNMEDTATWVKANPCVERRVGAETIKKCYELIEKKND